jgi:predicted phage-related endonuclease
MDNGKRESRVIYDIENRSRSAWLDLRRGNIGASDAAALFHAHPYKTALQLWAQQRGTLPDEDQADNDALRRGRILEPAVAAGLRETHPDWDVKPAGEYFVLRDYRLGATPDFYGWKDLANRDGKRFLIQVKTVLEDIYEADWTPSPPAHFLIQCQAEMLVTGIPRCILAVMVLDGRKFPIHEYAFDFDPEFAGELEAAAVKFWSAVDSGREPAIKHGQDGATLAQLYPQGHAEPVLALHGDNDFVDACHAYKAAAQRVKNAEAEKDAAATRIMAKLRSQSRAEARDFTVSWPTIPAMQVVQNRKAHRRLSVYRVKGAK